MNVGGYEILKRIGEGAYGKVYLARKAGAEGFRTYYALKRLRVEKRGDDAFEHYLLREARLGGLVNHPMLVRIHEVLRLDGEYVLVMDYVEGVTLRDVLGRRRGTGAGVGREVALELGADTLDALHYGHTLRDPEGNESGFVHRDVKPGNIMLTPGGSMKLMDFGVARLDDAPSGTQAGELRGTIAYMAPEQARGAETTAAADQFAAALILLEMLTGDPAWGDLRGAGILSRVVSGDVSEGLSRVSVDDPVRPVLERMLSSDAADRYATAEDAARALRGLRATLATPPALPDFVKAELAWFEEHEGGTEPVPSWSGSEASIGPVPEATDAGDPAFRSDGTWTDLDAVSDPAGVSLRVELTAPEGPELPDPERTLPIGSQAAVSAAALAAAEAAQAPAAPPAPLGAPPEAWSEKTLPFTAQATAPPTAPLTPGGAPPLPGGAPLPPPSLPRRRASSLDLAGSPLLSSVIGGLLVCLIFGLAWLLFRDTASPEGAAGADPTPTDVEILSADDGPRRARVAQVVIEEEPDPPQPTPDGSIVLDDRPGATLEPEEVAELDEPATPARTRERPTAARGGEPVPAREAWEDGTQGQEDPDVAERIVVAEEATPAAELRPGDVVGAEPVEPTAAERRRTTAEKAAAAEEKRLAEEAAGVNGGRVALGGVDTGVPTAEGSAGPALRFLSSREQPMGVPLSLRVRPEAFLAESVSVYYQWRGEGSSGRRKRSLRRQSDGSYALDIPTSELRADRLQLWFVAEPDGVHLASSGRPIEVRVR